MTKADRLTIREPRFGDVKPLVAISQEAFSAEQAVFGSDVRQATRRARLMTLIYPVQRRLPRPSTIALVGLVGDRPVGLVMAEPRGPTWYISTVMVSGDHRRRGYGRILVEAICERACSAGAVRAVLHMREDNTPAYGLYSSLGFRDFERAHRMLIENPVVAEQSPMPEGYALMRHSRYDRRVLATRDACREAQARELAGASRMPGLLERAMGLLVRPADDQRLAIVHRGAWVGFFLYLQESPLEAVGLIVAVLPEHRDRGLEHSLLERGLARAAQAGAERVTLSVGSTNTALLQASEALGFATRFVFVGMTRSLEAD